MTIGIIIAIAFAMFLIIWVPSYSDISDYTGGKDVIWITKNRTFNWFFTYFFPTHAIIYENLCDRINGDGLALLLVLFTLITLPISLIMCIIGAIVFIIRMLWRCFCRTFAREEEN